MKQTEEKTVHYKDGVSIKSRTEIEIAFKNAINKGLKDYGVWMYMYTLNKKDYFKNQLMRNYISFNEERRSYE